MTQDRLAEIKNIKYSGKVLLNVHWLIAELEHARSQLDWRAKDDGSTHSEECWKWHYGCAMAEIERLREDVMNARFVICMEREGHNFENDVCLGCGINRHNIPRNNSS